MLVCLKYNRDWINEESKEKYWCKELRADVPTFCKELKKKMCVEYHGAMGASGGNLKPGLMLLFHFNFVQIPKDNGKPLKAFKWEYGIIRTVENI